ncbi:LysM domain-containing protein [Thalassococcus profundi]|uniref:LysM domain-containing protein n=1 Tax=Thalassococcus profundi TaxID=2282382 RepID=A0A369TFW1_9RHOB|nr:LysM domain-containing protein [Thalassococcus profundi]RDD64140.1 LysM domain-containing protein [Thalassococcus profundi]
MIRTVLFALGFIAVTVGLIYFQPGGPDRADVSSPDVTRSDAALTDLSPALETPQTSPVPEPAAPEQISLATEPEPEPMVAVTRPAPPPMAGASDDLRRLTWDTMRHLNAATGRGAAPGAPGSLLHAIVQRSLTPSGHAPASDVMPSVYTVRPGDSLATIAEQVYGDVNMTGPLFAANQNSLAGPSDLKVGQELALPRP